MIPMNQNLNGLTRSPIRVYTDMARQIPDCVMLAIGEPDFDTPEPIKAAAVASLAAGHTHYAPNQGLPALRKAVAEAESRRGNPVGPEQVLITIGASQALFTALLGILNPGEEVIIPTPGFGIYDSITQIAGGKPVHLDVSRRGFQITREDLEAVITPKTKAILLNSPCNPTGVVFHRESLAAVKEAILGRPIFLIVDNVYQALTFGQEAPDLGADPQLAQQRILCQSFSKPYAMTGWRLGYLTCPEYVMERLLLLSSAQIAAVPTFLQEAALEALQQDTEPMRLAYQRRRDFVCRRLREMGLEFPEPQGAFYVFPDIRPYGLSSDEFCSRMIREAKVAAVPGLCFGLEGYIRLSYCCSDGELALGMDRMEAFLHSLGARP